MNNNLFSPSSHWPTQMENACSCPYFESFQSCVKSLHSIKDGWSFCGITHWFPLLEGCKDMDGEGWFVTVKLYTNCVWPKIVTETIRSQVFLTDVFMTGSLCVTIVFMEECRLQKSQPWFVLSVVLCHKNTIEITTRSTRRIEDDIIAMNIAVS